MTGLSLGTGPATCLLGRIELYPPKPLYDDHYYRSHTHSHSIDYACIYLRKNVDPLRGPFVPSRRYLLDANDAIDVAGRVWNVPPAGAARDHRNASSERLQPLCKIPLKTPLSTVSWVESFVASKLSKLWLTLAPPTNDGIYFLLVSSSHLSSLSFSVFFPNRIREFEARIIFQTSKHPKEERRILEFSCCYSSKSKRKPPAFSLFLAGDRSLRGMEREWRVNPDCVNASNPFHVCAEYCVQRAHVLKPRSPRPKLGLFFSFSLPIDSFLYFFSDLICSIFVFFMYRALKIWTL